MTARTAFTWMILCLVLKPNAFSATTMQKHDDFAADPHWKLFSTRKAPEEWPRVTQSFGYAAGQIGGIISRSTAPASYARIIKPKTLDQHLRATGKFRVTKNLGNSGVLFGWFKESSRGWRTPNSLVFRIDGNGPSFWMFFEYGTQSGFTGGKGCFKGDRYQTTPTKPFSADGAIHTWSLEYNPAGNENRGEITFVLDNLPWTLPLHEGARTDGGIFNRFGILNQQLSGDGVEAWFTDLTLDGERIDLSSDPNWEGRANKTNFTDKIVRPFDNAAWRATSLAGGAAGEIGGVFWRDDPPAFYAAPIGKLSLDNELFAAGRIVMTGAAADSGVYIGWFNAASKTNRSVHDRSITQTNSLAIAIEGPSQVGHYFRAAAWNSAGEGILQLHGPVIGPDSKPRRWSLRYSPQGADGRGLITVTLDAAQTSIALPDRMRQKGAEFDHFGFFNFQPDGHYVQIFIDDLEYSANR
jgi:hypothetical protein